MGICYSQQYGPSSIITLDSAVVQYGYLVRVYVKPKEKGIAYPEDFFYFKTKPKITKELTPKRLLKKADFLIYNNIVLNNSNLYRMIDSTTHLYSQYNSNPVLNKKIKGNSRIKIFEIALVYSKTTVKNISLKEYTEISRLPTIVSHFHKQKELFDKQIKLIEPELITPLKCD